MVPTWSLLASSLLFTAAYATFRQKFHLPNLFKFRASYHTAAADVTLHLDVIRTIGEHLPIQEQKLKQSAVSSPLGRCIIVPPLVLVIVNLTATTPLLRFLIATGVAEDSGFAVPSLEGRLARRHP